MNFTDTKTTQATDSQPSLQDSRPAQTMDGCQAAAHFFRESNCISILWSR